MRTWRLTGAPLPPFANGDRVTVKLPDGSGFVLENVRVVFVDGRTGNQVAEADEMRRWDLEGVAVPITEEELCLPMTKSL